MNRNEFGQLQESGTTSCVLKEVQYHNYFATNFQVEYCQLLLLSLEIPGYVVYFIWINVNGITKHAEEVTTAKLLRDVMRSSVIKMGFDPIDAVAIFNNVEQLFTIYSVPEHLQARLINPYLSERAQRIVIKLRPENTS